MALEEAPMNDPNPGYAADLPDDEEFGELDLDLGEIEDLDDEAEFEDLEEYEFADECDFDAD